jgi:hypothetical protein
MYLREGDNGNWAGVFDLGSGGLKAGAGGVSTPAISFSADSNTGLYVASSATQITIGGSRKAVINSSIGPGIDVAAYYPNLATNAGAPPAGDCDADDERGRMTTDHTNDRYYVCGGATRGWDYKDLTD